MGPKAPQGQLLTNIWGAVSPAGPFQWPVEKAGPGAPSSRRFLRVPSSRDQSPGRRMGFKRSSGPRAALAGGSKCPSPPSQALG